MTTPETPEAFDELIEQAERAVEGTPDLWTLELMKQKVDSLRSTLENRIKAAGETEAG